MPIYEYACKQCGKITDVLQKMSDPAPEQCASCGAQGTLERVVSRTSFVLKGGGWSSDLYGSPKKDAKKEGGDSASTPAPAPAGGPGDKAAGATSSSSGSTGAAASSSTSSSSASSPSSSPSSSSSSSSEKK